jgi:hypothetical protein
MKTYSIDYSLMGGGNISIRAKSKLLAEEALFDTSIEDLLLYADFSDGLEIMQMDIHKERF